MNPIICHACGAAMTRDAREVTLHYQEQSLTVVMPGWYCACGESVHSGVDMEVSDQALMTMKSREQRHALIA